MMTISLLAIIAVATPVVVEVEVQLQMKRATHVSVAVCSSHQDSACGDNHKLLAEQYLAKEAVNAWEKMPMLHFCAKGTSCKGDVFLKLIIEDIERDTSQLSEAYPNVPELRVVYRLIDSRKRPPLLELRFPVHPEAQAKEYRSLSVLKNLKTDSSYSEWKKKLWFRDEMRAKCLEDMVTVLADIPVFTDVTVMPDGRTNTGVRVSDTNIAVGSSRAVLRGFLTGDAEVTFAACRDGAKTYVQGFKIDEDVPESARFQCPGKSTASAGAKTLYGKGITIEAVRKLD